MEEAVRERGTLTAPHRLPPLRRPRSARGSREQAPPPGATSGGRRSGGSSSSAGTEEGRAGGLGVPLSAGSDSALETQTMVFERGEKTAERDWQVGQDVSEADRNDLYTELGGEPEGEHTLI